MQLLKVHQKPLFLIEEEGRINLKRQIYEL